MTALVSSNSTFLLGHPTDNPANSGGILLNSRSLSAPLHPRGNREPSSFASSSSSASQTSESPSAFADTSSRRIRFAPLPDPRREDFPSVFYDTDSDSQSPRTRNPPTPPESSPQSPPSPRLSPTELRPAEPPSKSKTRTWGRKLLRPLLYPLLPSSPTNGEESYSALFRISSRDSTKDNHDSAESSFKGGVPLGRRMSTGSNAIASAKETERSHAFSFGAPLTPVMSEGSSSKGRKDGQRMLNGRVYGRRPNSADPQETQTAYEPEFVEWGYGGMGSVNSDSTKGTPTAGPDWAKLQSGGKVLGESGEGDPEGDDGSGMGWVKRRREQREREKKEKELCEKSQQKQSVPEIAIHPPESKECTDQPRPPSTREDSTRIADSKLKEVEELHLRRAVSIPAPHHHHTRHHSHHKGGDASGSITPTSVASLSRTNSAGSVPLVRTPSLGSPRETLAPTPEKIEDIESSATSSASITSSISEDEEDENDTERESDDEEADDDAGGRLTSKGAGVEKISRHK